MESHTDNRVSYDDGKTLAQKASFADSLCLGGLFAWALDLGGPGITASPHDPSIVNDTDLGSTSPSAGGIVYIATDIWSDDQPTVTCNPPCTFVFPPKSLSEPRTIEFPPYTTSLEVAWSTSYSTVVNGQSLVTTTIARTVQQTVLTVPPGRNSHNTKSSKPEARLTKNSHHRRVISLELEDNR